jgi:hypothetical protein
MIAISRIQNGIPLKKFASKRGRGKLDYEALAELALSLVEHVPEVKPDRKKEERL